MYYNRPKYELDDTGKYLEDTAAVMIVAGTQENFYEQKKRYLKNKRRTSYATAG